jgi:hypothetical protein
VTEIFDARLALHPYFDRRVAELARASGLQAGLCGEDLDAHIEAALLVSALGQREPTPPQHRAELTHLHDDGDMPSVLRYLSKVAGAYSHTPVVPDLKLRDLQATVPWRAE